MPWELDADGATNDFVSTISSLRNKFFTTRKNSFYRHYSNTVPYNNFYGQQGTASIDFIFNDNPSVVKNFRTVNYEGSDNWRMDFLSTEYESTKTIPSYINGSYYIPNVQDPQYLVLGFGEKKVSIFQM